MNRNVISVLGLAVTALVSLGLVVLYSASQGNALRLHNDPYFFFNRQIIYFAVAIVIGVVTALVDYHRWRDKPLLTGLAYGFVILLLGLVFLFPKVNGSARWIKVGVLRIQPSEFAKVFSVVVTAALVDFAAHRVRRFFRGALLPALALGLLAGLVLIEPDYGSVAVICAAGALVMWIGGTRLAHLVYLAIPAAGIFIYRVATNANRMARLFAFFGRHPDAAAGVSDAAADRAAYQAEQARIAISNGGPFGAGLNNSMQKLLYLPEAHTDFIFAVGAEELGLGFSVAVTALFAVVFGCAVYIALKAGDRFGRYLAFGMGFLIFFQAFFNLGVVCEALPTKGIALPFFSYGGSNMLTAAFAIGTIISVALHTRGDRNAERVVSVTKPKRRPVNG